MIPQPFLEQNIHPDILSSLSKYHAKSNEFTVLNFNFQAPLCSKQASIVALLGLLDQKLQADKKVLEYLKIFSFDNEYAKGITEYVGSHENVRFQKIQVFGEISDDIELLQDLIKTLSQKSIGLDLSESEGLTQEHCQKLVDFIKKNNICMDLLLPKKFQTDPVQRELDIIFSYRRFNPKTGTAHQGPQQKEEVISHPTVLDVPTEIMTRPRTLAFDVSSAAVEKAVDKDTETEKSASIDTAQETAQAVSPVSKYYKSGEFFSFFCSVCRGNIAVGSSNQCLTELSLEKLWNAWLMPETVCQGISKEACEELLKYPKKFTERGLSFNHLPKGFVFQDINGDRVLHYDAQLAKTITEPDPMAIQLQLSPARKPLPYPVFDKLLNELPKEHILRQKWDSIFQGSDGRYHRVEAEMFRTCFLDLLRFSNTELERVFNFCEEKGTFSQKRFEFFMENLESLIEVRKNTKDHNQQGFTLQGYASLNMGRFESRNPVERFIENRRTVAFLQQLDKPNSNLMALVNLNRIFGEQDMSVIMLVEILSKKKSEKISEPPPISPMDILLKDRPDLIKKMEEFYAIIINFDYTDSSSDKLEKIQFEGALLQVYSRAGVQGVETVFGNLKNLEDIFRGQQKYFKDCLSFEPFLSEQYTQAIQYISELDNPFEKEFLKNLLIMHCKTVGHDDLPQLVNAFKAFKEKLKALSIRRGVPLEFTLSSNILCRCQYSLPVALLKMLTILEKCDTRDLEAQWKLIYEALDLNPVHLNQMMQDSNEDHRFGFILPQFRYKYESEDRYDSYAQEHFTPAIQILYQLSTISQRASLNFYLKAFANVEGNSYLAFDRTECFKEVTEDQAKLLYKLTTSHNAGYLEGDDVALNQWDCVLKFLEDPKLKEIGLVEIIHNMTSPPPLPILFQLLTFASLDQKALVFVKQILEKARKYGPNIFRGLRFYDLSQIKTEGDFKKSPFYDYKEALDSLDKIPQEYRPMLVGLISTFGLTQKDILEFKNIVFAKKIPPEIIQYALSLLDQMKKNSVQNPEGKEKRLSAEDFEEFLRELSNDYQKNDVLKLLEKTFSPYFPEGFFVSQQSGVAVSTRIVGQYFNDGEEQKTIKAIFVKFPQARAKDLEQLSRQIAAICKRCSPKDRVQFLRALSRSDLIPNGCTLQEFESLIKAIMKQGRTSDFIYFFKQYDSFYPQSKGVDHSLLKRATLYENFVLQAYKVHSDLPRDFFLSFSMEYLSKCDPKDLEGSEDRLTEAYKTLSSLRERYSGMEDVLFEFLKTGFYDSKLTQEGCSLPQSVLNFIARFEKISRLIDQKAPGQKTPVFDSNLVLSLCFHFKNGPHGYQPSDLNEIFNIAESVSSENKPLFFKVVFSLLKNGLDNKESFVKELSEVVRLCSVSPYGSVFLKSLEVFYKTAPLPSLNQLFTWYNEAAMLADHLPKEKRDNAFESKLNEFYKSFDIVPSVTREKANGFNFGDVQTKQAILAQVKKFKGTSGDFEASLSYLSDKVQEARGKPTKDLLDELKHFKKLQKLPLDPKPASELLALVAELLYRSKGKEGSFGSTFEINSTQYLSLYFILTAGPHVTAQIGTGEGKSRDMMLLNACYCLLGYTVDFITSNSQLAKRDYDEFQPFFELLGIQTSRIHAGSPTEHYKKGGVNFSDIAGINLFRDKARSEGRGMDVIEDDPAKRAALCDEVDVVYFDSYMTHYNYSTQADVNLRGLEWVYLDIMRFIAQDNGNFDEDSAKPSLYHTNTLECAKNLKKYLMEKCSLQSTQYQQLERLPLSQYVLWLDMAVKARSLEFLKDYVIETNVQINTSEGPKTSSAALIVDRNNDGAVLRGSKWSYGLHQLLHAKLELLRQSPEDEVMRERLRGNSGSGQNVTLAGKLRDCGDNVFYAEPEKQIVYSATSDSCASEYQNGVLIGLTGSAGSEAERIESSERYGAPIMHVIEVPRHRGLKRQDLPIRMVADDKPKKTSPKIEALVKYIQEARREGRPVVLICENEEGSLKTFDALQKALGGESIQRIGALDSLEDKQRKIDGAGCKNMVTVSTNLIGRGTDIKISDEQNRKGGLRVLVDHVPSARTLQQIQGRAGRQGNHGDARIVVSRADLRKFFGRPHLKRFFRNPEDEIMVQHEKNERKAQSKRLIVNTINQFRSEFQNEFFNEALKGQPENIRNVLILEFIGFMEERNQKWNGVFDTISKLLDDLSKSSKDSERAHISQEVVSALEAYEKTTQEEWEKFKGKVQAKYPDIHFLESRGKEDAKSRAGQSIANISSFLTGNRKEHVSKVSFHRHYDLALDGRAVVYENLSARWEAFKNRPLFAGFRAWARGDGILFPNLRAWWNGDITFKQYIYLWKHEEVKELSESTTQIVSALQISPSQSSVGGAGSVSEHLNSSQNLGDSFSSGGSSTDSSTLGDLVGEVKRNHQKDHRDDGTPNPMDGGPLGDATPKPIGAAVKPIQEIDQSVRGASGVWRSSW